MDYGQMTAPCGLDCFNCIAFLAKEDPNLRTVIAKALDIPIDKAEKAVCKGCRNHGGKIPFLPMECHVYPCAKGKGISFCYECAEFPCDRLHPYADQAAKVPHNTKVFNLCLIKRLGLKTWAEEKAKGVRENYFKGSWKL